MKRHHRPCAAHRRLKSRAAAALLAFAVVAAGSAAQAACLAGPAPADYDSTKPIDTSRWPELFANPAAGAFGAQVARATRGVTNIRLVKNLTDCPLTIRKVDGRGRLERESVAPRATEDTDMWIPWADDAATYADHHMIVSVDGRDLLWIYQDRGVVRFRPSPGYRPNAQPVPGLNMAAGGDVELALMLMSTGRPAFRFKRRE